MKGRGASSSASHEVEPTILWRRDAAAGRLPGSPSARAGSGARRKTFEQRRLRLRQHLARAHVVEARCVIEQVGDGKAVGQGFDIQSKLLSLLYVKCRQNAREPGIGEIELERLSGCPIEHLEFHLWYLKEKGWVRRMENGTLAITAEGVDRTNSEHLRRISNNLLTDQRPLG